MGTLVKLVYDLKKWSTTEDSPTLNTDCFPLSSFQQLQVIEGQLQQEDYKTAVVRFHISIEQFNSSIKCVSVFIFCSLYMVQKVVNHVLKSYLHWLGRFDMEWLSNKKGLAWWRSGNCTHSNWFAEVKMWMVIVGTNQWDWWLRISSSYCWRNWNECKLANDYK